MKKLSKRAIEVLSGENKMKTKLKLKPCPYCGGKMIIQEYYSIGAVMYLNYEQGSMVSLCPKCEGCQTEYPKVRGEDFKQEIFDLVWNKIRERWEEI